MIGLSLEHGRTDEVQRRVAADGVVEAVDVVTDGGLGLDAGEEHRPPDQLRLQGLEPKAGEANKVSTMALS